MIEIHLNEKEKSFLEERHRKTSNSNQSDRIKAVLLRAEGWSAAMIAQALRKHEASINRHLEAYASEQRLKAKHIGSKGKLDDAQTQELILHLTENLYQHNHQIKAYIKGRWGIDFTVPGLHKWLHRHGFVYKKPKGHPHKADAEEQAKFVEKYIELKSSSGADEPILFADSVHPTQSTKLSYGWLQKGSQKAVKTTASRTRLNIIGAIQLGALDKALTERYDTINAENVVKFLHKIRASYSESKQIHLIIDGAGYHKSKLVLKEAERLKIKLHFLPPYSPNLNPIERLWKVMNKKIRDNRFFESAKEFRQKIDEFLKETLPKIAISLNTLINDNFQMLKTAN